LPIKTSATLPCEAADHETITWLKDGVPVSTLATKARIYVDGDNTLTIKGRLIFPEFLTIHQYSEHGHSGNFKGLKFISFPIVTYFTRFELVCCL